MNSVYVAKIEKNRLSTYIYTLDEKLRVPRDNLLHYKRADINVSEVKLPNAALSLSGKYSINYQYVCSINYHSRMQKNRHGVNSTSIYIYTYLQGISKKCAKYL